VPSGRLEADEETAEGEKATHIPMPVLIEDGV